MQTNLQTGNKDFISLKYIYRFNGTSSRAFLL